MDCSKLVDALLTHEELISMLAIDSTGTPAIYQIIASSGEVFPRIAVFEVDRFFSAYADDVPLEERTQYRLDIFARENVLRELTAALHYTIIVEGFTRITHTPDNYLPDLDIMTKSLICEYTEALNSFD